MPLPRKFRLCPARQAKRIPEWSHGENPIDSIAPWETFSQDQDTVAQQGELGQFRRDQHDRQALFGELLDQAVNVRLGPDIDPAGWLVQKQNFGNSLEPLSDDQLLLVTAAERARDLLRAPRVNPSC